MKKLICVLLAAVMILALTACDAAPQETTHSTTLPPETTLPIETTQPPLTAKGVVEQMVQALEGKKMTGGTMAVTVSVSFARPEEEKEMEMEVSVKTDIKMSRDPIAAYSDAEISMKMNGLNVTYGTESYVVTEDGKLVSYAHMLMDDSWTKSAVTAEQEQDLNRNADFTWLLEKLENELTLEEEIQTVNGREVYVLSCTLTGEEMRKTLDSTSGMEESLAEMGVSPETFAALQVPTVYHIDAHTFYPVELQMNVEGFGELINSMLSGTLGMDTEASIPEIKAGDVRMSMTDLSYDPVEVPPVPQEAYDATANTGVYLLEEDGKTIRVTLPVEWIVYDAPGDTLTVVKNDSSQMALFIIYADITGIDFKQEIEDTDVADLKLDEMYVAHGMGDAIGTYETMWVEDTEGMNYYAWGPVGDAYIFVLVVDYEGQSMEEALTPMLNAISIPPAE